jgi:hypothetical protein
MLFLIHSFSCSNAALLPDQEGGRPKVLKCIHEMFFRNTQRRRREEDICGTYG